MTENLLRVIGIDPGPTPGIVALCYHKRKNLIETGVIQCSWGLSETLLRAVLDDADIPTLLQIEKFIVSTRASRSSHQGAGGLTRTLIPKLFGVFDEWRNVTINAPEAHLLNSRYFERPAVRVKAWATDTRLEKVGLITATKGMSHARDAARHALFAAVRDGGIPDPLSKRGAD